jgi:DnaJ-class molecular chaperone
VLVKGIDRLENFKDYYRLLKIGPAADAAAIKVAFRRLARRHHPDVAKDKRTARQFASIVEAYQILSDPEKRRQYDRVRSARRRASRRRGAKGGPRRSPDQARIKARRFGVALGVLGLRVSLAVDTEIRSE